MPTELCEKLEKDIDMAMDKGCFHANLRKFSISMNYFTKMHFERYLRSIGMYVKTHQVARLDVWKGLNVLIDPTLLLFDFRILYQK